MNEKPVYPITLKAEKSHLVFEHATALVVATINNRPALYDANALAEKLATAHNDYDEMKAALQACLTHMNLWDTGKNTNPELKELIKKLIEK